ncbi:hypothetical protein HZH68_000989 [Vespula germanica]|uniref:Uncharacterized protein n=1 Tax=Vespula germanica TaxID=30212 RepID=A0A834U6E2_VESGE|nr:hypothetical protein HZH68_000989 [Vespula germanica]
MPGCNRVRDHEINAEAELWRRLNEVMQIMKSSANGAQEVLGTIGFDYSGPDVHTRVLKQQVGNTHTTTSRDCSDGEPGARPPSHIPINSTSRKEVSRSRRLSFTTTTKKEEQYRIRSSCFWSQRDTSYRLRDGEPDAREFATSKRTSTTQIHSSVNKKRGNSRIKEIKENAEIKKEKRETVYNYSRWSSHEKDPYSVTILLRASANGLHQGKRAYVLEVDGCKECEATVFGVEVAVEDVINLGIDVMRDRGRSWLSA